MARTKTLSNEKQRLWDLFEPMVWAQIEADWWGHYHPKLHCSYAEFRHSTRGHLKDFTKVWGTLFANRYTRLHNRQLGSHLLPADNTIRNWVERKTLFPNLIMRNALAVYIGYQDWDEFCALHPPTPPTPQSLIMWQRYLIRLRIESWVPERIPQRLLGTGTPDTQVRMGWGIILSLLLLLMLAGGLFTLLTPKPEPEWFSDEQLAKVVFRPVERLEGQSPRLILLEYDFSSLGVNELELYHGNNCEDPPCRSVLTEPKGRAFIRHYKPYQDSLQLQYKGRVVAWVPFYIPSDPKWLGTYASVGKTRERGRQQSMLRATFPGYSFYPPDSIRPNWRDQPYWVNSRLFTPLNLRGDRSEATLRFWAGPAAHPTGCGQVGMRLFFSDSKEIHVFVPYQANDSLSPMPITAGTKQYPALPRQPKTEKHQTLRIQIQDGQLVVWLNERVLGRWPTDPDWGTFTGISIETEGSIALDHFNLRDHSTGQVYLDEPFDNRPPVSL